MEKSDIIKIVVVAFVALFLIEQYFFSSGGKLLPSFSEPKQYEGIASFNGTMMGYDPLLALTVKASPELLAELKARDEVVTVEPQGEVTVVKLQTSEDVLPLAKIMKERKINVVSNAKIVTPATLSLSTADGEITARASGLVVRIPIEPVLEEGDEIGVDLPIAIKNSQIVGTGQAQAISERKQLSTDVTITVLKGVAYTYDVPWDSRTKMNLEFPAFNPTRKVVNSITFKPALTIDTVVTKRPLSYIVYIDQNGAEISANFTDKNQIISDFNQTSVSFAPSKLILVLLSNSTINGTTANDSVINGSAIIDVANVSPPETGFTLNSTIYAYDVELQSQISGYTNSEHTQFVSMQQKYSIGTHVTLNVSGIIIGKKIYWPQIVN